tara:strand:+ start:179 stop:2407 length:2229 start_codon:yes stop_codon:yes gene_type:complete
MKPLKLLPTILLFIISIGLAAAGTSNVSHNYVYNGSDWIPWLSAPDGSPYIDLDLINITASNLIISNNVTIGGNVSLGKKLMFELGEMIDNIKDGWLKLTGNLNVTENLQVTGNTTIAGNLNVTGDTYFTNINITGVVFSDGSAELKNITVDDAIKSSGNISILPSSGLVSFNTTANITTASGNIKTAGNVTAAKFVGDGSKLTGLTNNSINYGYNGSDMIPYKLDPDGTLKIRVKSNVANDLECSDCIGANEISDVYVLNTGDTIAGNLIVNGSLNVTNTTYFGTQAFASIDASGSINALGNLTINNSVFFVNRDTGNIGIGTTTPATTLDISKSDNTTLTIGPAIGAGTSRTSDIEFKAMSSGDGTSRRQTGNIEAGWSGADYVNSYLKLRTLDSDGALTDGLIITGGGDVGIGVNPPLDKFHVNNGTDQNFAVAASYSGTGVSISAYNDAKGANNVLELRGSPVVFTVGDIGIKNTDPQTELDIGGGSSEDLINLRAGSGVNHTIGVDTGGILIRDRVGGTTQHYLASTSGGSTFFAQHGGKVGIGNTSPQHTLSVQGDLYVDGDCVEKDGACADIAEPINANKDEPLESGDVLVIDISSDQWHITKSTKPYDTKIAGIYTSNPALYMGTNVQIGVQHNFTSKAPLEHNGKVPLALAGQVPVKVTLENGIINKGDLLTTSSTPGHAMKFTLLDPRNANTLQEQGEILWENEQRRNSILGKSLEPCKENVCKITALVTLQ